MKKIFTLILLMSCIATASAQTRGAKYQGEVQAGYGIGIGTLGSGRVYIQTIQGIRPNQYFSAGLGIGVNAYTSSPDVYIPIFLNTKGYLPINERTDLFLSLDLGHSVCLTEEANGFMFTPAIGISLKTIRNSAVNISLGFDNQRWYGVANDDVISIKIGYQF